MKYMSQDVFGDREDCRYKIGVEACTSMLVGVINRQSDVEGGV
jgi:hypothetical protein